MPVRFLPTCALLCALLLSACTPDAPAPGAPAAAPADTKAARAAAAGLSDSDLAYIDSSGVAAVVPVMPDGWQFVEAFVEKDEDAGAFVPFYSITYLTADSTCVSLSANPEPADAWTAAPPNERMVAVPGGIASGPVRLGWGAAGAGEPDDLTWLNTVATEGFGTRGVTYVAGSSTDEGCRLASPDDVEALLKTLRPLDPVTDL